MVVQKFGRTSVADPPGATSEVHVSVTVEDASGVPAIVQALPAFANVNEAAGMNRLHEEFFG